jgi:hypothetical protein
MDANSLGGFGDTRLRKVGGALLSAMQQAPTMCLQSLGKDRNEALRYGRFLDNDAVSADEMLVHAGRLTGERVAGRQVLAIQDTTEFHFAAHSAHKRGFGRGGNGEDIGLFLHPMIAVDAAHGGLLGLVGATVLNRIGGKAAGRKQREADAKESRRWLSGAETASEVLVEAAMITVIADRESDVYDLFARRPANVHLLIRAAQDRALQGNGCLFAHCAAWPERQRYQIEVPGHGKKPGRVATVALRFGQVDLKRTPNAAKTLPDTVTLHLVDVAEIDPPTGQEPVHWCLLTTHAVTTPDEARRIVEWYKCRWTIEQVFRTLKTDGVRVEASQVIEATSFVKLVVVALIAAVRVMQIVLGRDGSTGQSLADAADPHDMPALQAINASLQGNTENLKNPHQIASLAWFAWIVARLGGWSGYASQGYKPPDQKPSSVASPNSTE